MMLFTVLALSFLSGARASGAFGSYFVDWAHWRSAPYTYTAADLAPIAPRLSETLYSFIYFCPPAGTNPMPYWALPPYASCTDQTEYQFIFLDDNDPQYVSTIKAQNPDMKLLVSVGGWNFPSNYFSIMASTSDNRQKFIAAAMSFMQQYGFDGLDIDWEFPGSPPREDPVKISCTQFQYVEDLGGSPADTDNIVSLAQELRSAFGSQYLLTMASQAAYNNEQKENIVGVSPYIDWWHVMSYDYAVSDLDDATIMSPNCPLYNPPAPALQMSVDQTIQDYLKAGVPASKLMLGIPLYGHTWYNTTLGSNNQWQQFGNNAQMQGQCCGPFQATYGAKPGQGGNLCGSYMYSEFQAAGFDTFFDIITQSNVGYMSGTSKDGYTAAGTWITYNDKDSVSALVDYANKMGLRGAFVYDSSMDSIENGQFTYQLMNTIADSLGRPSASTPSKTTK